MSGESPSESDPIRTEFAFELQVACDPPQIVGASKFGQHRVIGITGGTFAGPRIQGEVLPGGADWQVVRHDEVLELEARYLLRADDGSIISVRNRGIAVQHPTPNASAGAQSGAPDPASIYARTAPEFEAASDGPHAWLNSSLFVATLAVISFAPLLIRLRVFRVL
jgi:hypothetical protein